MVDLLKRYIENRVQLLRLNLIEAISNVAAGLVSSFLLLIMGIMIIFMFSISLAFWFSTFFESEVIGFALMGVVYLVFFLFYYAFARKRVETRIKDEIVEGALKGDDPEDDKEVQEAKDVKWDEE